MILNWKDLFTGKDGRMSHVKLWANIASLTATAVIIWSSWKGVLTYEIFGLYLVTVGGYYTVGKWLDLKHGMMKPPEPPETEVK